MQPVAFTLWGELGEKSLDLFRFPMGERTPATPEHQGNQLPVVDAAEGLVRILYYKGLAVYMETAVFDLEGVGVAQFHFLLWLLLCTGGSIRGGRTQARISF